MPATGLRRDQRATPTERHAARRAPVQERSRRRVEAILDATERLVVERGVEALTTRDIARAADVPVASVYQYFADKEAVLLALVERHTSEMDEQVARDLADLETLSVATLVRTTMEAFVRVYHQRRAFVEIYLRGRTNPAIHRFGRAHNRTVAEALHALGVGEGLVADGLTLDVAVLAVEVGDRVFQLAFEHDDRGDAATIEEGVVLVTAYLERHATRRGLRGVER